MKENSKNHRRTKLAIWLVPILLGTGVARADEVADARRPLLRAQGARALSDAIHDLVTRYGIVIHFEEAKASDPAEAPAATSTPRVLGTPEAAAVLAVRLAVGERGNLEDPAASLADLIAEHQRLGLPGKYQIRAAGAGLAVVPLTARNAGGDLAFQTAWMEEPLELEMKSLPFPEALRRFCAALSNAKGGKVSPFYFAAGPLDQLLVTVPAGRRPAAETLDRILAALGQPMAWALFHQPELGMSTLALTPVRGPLRSPVP